MPNYLQRLPELQPSNVARNYLAGRKYKEDREDRGRRMRLEDLGEQRSATEFEWNKADRPAKLAAEARKLKKEELEASTAVLEYATQYVPMVQWDEDQKDWTAFREHMIEAGMDERLLPRGFKSKLDFEGWRNNALNYGKDLKEIYDTETARRKSKGQDREIYYTDTTNKTKIKVRAGSEKQEELDADPGRYKRGAPVKEKSGGDTVKEKEAKALKRISGIEEKIYKIKTTGTLDPMGMAMLKSIDSDAADALSGGDKEAAIAALENEKAVLYEKDVSQENRPAATVEPAGGAVTHEFDPDKGLVEITK